MSTTPSFDVTCYSCKSSFDGLAAGFCSCLSSERTLLWTSGEPGGATA